MKLVKEYINEKFEEESDPIHDLDIGIIPKIKKWLSENGLDGQYTINEDGTVDIHGKLRLNEYKRIPIPDYIKFRNVYGLVNVPETINTLKGFPDYIDGNFACYTNNLTSLDGCPKIVTGEFYCMGFSKKQIRKKCIVGKEIHNGRTDESLNEKFTEDSDPIHDMGIGMMNKIKKFVESKGYLSDVDRWSKEKLLVFCAQNKKFDFVEFLLDYYDIDLTYLSGIAFRWISHTDNTKLMQKFLDKGQDINLSSGSENALYNAIHEKNEKMIKFLIQKGIFITESNIRSARSLDKKLYNYIRKKYEKQTSK